MRKILLAAALLLPAAATASDFPPSALEAQCAGAEEGGAQLRRCLDEIAVAVRRLQEQTAACAQEVGVLWRDKYGLVERGLGGANGKGLGDNPSSR
jgi:hypothetical protein